jgi:hypothetical protein
MAMIEVRSFDAEGLVTMFSELNTMKLISECNKTIDGEPTSLRKDIDTFKDNLMFKLKDLHHDETISCTLSLDDLVMFPKMSARRNMIANEVAVYQLLRYIMTSEVIECIENQMLSNIVSGFWENCNLQLIHNVQSLFKNENVHGLKGLVTMPKGVAMIQFKKFNDCLLVRLDSGYVFSKGPFDEHNDTVAVQGITGNWIQVTESIINMIAMMMSGTMVKLTKPPLTLVK